MEFPVDTAFVIIVSIGIFGMMRWLDVRFGDRLSETECERKIAELEERVKWLLNQYQDAMARIQELEAANRSGVPKNESPAKPMLLLCGPDNALCDSDRHALRRAQISFQRLVDCNRQQLEDELRRRRQDGTLYTWVHITAHATAEGIRLRDGVADPSFWNETLIGIKVVFLAACQTAAVADALAGMVTVVYVLEDIENRDASAFTYAFWRRMREHGDPQRAYRQAVLEAPQVAEFTDIRTG